MTITTLNLLVLVLVFLVLLVGHETVSIQLFKEEGFNIWKINHSIHKGTKVKYGSIYDCVDFYKQPAFNHPFLKNHNFHHEMRPKFALGDQRDTNSCPSCQENSTLFRSVELEEEGCPMGTVPIKRISKNDSIQMNKFTKEYNSKIKPHRIPSQTGTHFAVLETKSDPSQVKYYGVKGIFNVYRLSVGPSQYSSGEIIIQNEEDSIQVGWTINPSINKDNDKHLFQYMNAGQLHCFNTLCPGFVVTSKEVSIDTTLAGESIRGGVQFVLPLTVYQDPKDGNWWLEAAGKVVGFWPRQLFKKLGNGATYIAVGGETYSPSDQPLPPMGNGYYPVQDITLSTFCCNLTVLDANRQWVNPEVTETYVNDNHYGIYDMGQTDKYGRLAYYGGTTLWA